MIYVALTELNTPEKVHWYYRLLDYMCRKKPQKGPQNLQSSCCGFCSSAVDTALYEVIKQPFKNMGLVDWSRAQKTVLFARVA
jgi:hypothetical protein